MKVRFRTQGPSGDEQPRDQAAPLPPNTVTGAIPFTPALLDRHRARTLRATEAALAPGQEAPRSTAYRSDVLLVPRDVLEDAETMRAFEQVLSGVGFRAVPAPDVERLLDRQLSDSRFLKTVPRPVRLRPLDGGPPRVLDAWTALQALRAAAVEGKLPGEIVARVGPEHLLVGSACVGAGGVPIGGVNVATEGSAPPGGIVSYSRAGFGGRIPVDVVLRAPTRRDRKELPDGRRIVVAVLDSGLQPHLDDWIDIAERAAFQDEFATVDTPLQQAIAAVSAADPDAGVPVIDSPWDSPYTEEPLVGELTTHFGHGTFIAGIVRQVAPDAEVRSIRVMHSDGVVEESTLLAALHLLAAEVEEALRAGKPRPIDVLSLSLGYFDEGPADPVTSLLASILGDLAAMGVAVVAAAGNYATSRRFYPAAFSDLIAIDGAVPILGVGALNPNGTVALFSDDGPWVNCWATGSCVVSTFPTIRSGSEQAATTPEQASAGLVRQTVDPDDFSSGFAVWSGTSFAAPLVAAKVALALRHGVADASVGLDVHDPAGVLEKVIAAVRAHNGGTP
ncbi:S8/S53 family peptidase [Actinopolymorpha alba]|uniref:S8/S53 family peptidase n=1 Tax=Actinopolymorpha alba TaxID=533267 RepID=UPI00036AF50F|nr:S8/S53 family peptidase [Actinopolymorpha alba]